MVTKKEVEKYLKECLNKKNIDKDTKKTIMDSMDKKIEKGIEKKKDERDKEKVVARLNGEKSEVSHGTSCPRVMTRTGDLIIEL